MIDCSGYPGSPNYLRIQAYLVPIISAIIAKALEFSEIPTLPPESDPN